LREVVDREPHDVFVQVSVTVMVTVEIAPVVASATVKRHVLVEGAPSETVALHNGPATAALLIDGVLPLDVETCAQE
jgi:hypothetical protein